MQNKKASLHFIEKCYRLYEQKMYQIAYSILRDEGMAEDAVQEAFLKLMKSDTYFRDVKSDDCKRYIITVIKHSSITIYNKKKREQEVMYLSGEDDDFDRAEEKADDERQNLRLLMDKLPHKYFEVVNCMVVKELSVKETARELAITEANVRKRFERAKLLLKTIVKGSGEYEEFRII
jgi:RNA polymerase sigma-70 factor (ECF subfamily)